MVLAISCSKEEASPTNPDSTKSTTSVIDKNFVDGIHGNEFVTSQLNSVMTHYNEITNFANNTGNNNFSESEPGPEFGSFTIENVTYPLDYGANANWGGGQFSIYLVGPGLTNFEMPNAVIFNILSPIENDIAFGTYFLSDNHEPYTCNWAQVNINNEIFLDFIEASLSITNSGNSFSTSFYGILENGKNISGNYSGELDDMEITPQPPQGNISATVDNQLWVAMFTNSILDDDIDVFIMYGSGNNNSKIRFELKASMIHANAHLTISNGGVYSAAYHSSNSAFYANTNASVNITMYTSTSISGTFEFEGIDLNSNPIMITNGIFTNMPNY